MTPSDLIGKLHSGERVFGTLIVSPSPRWPDAVRQCGLDFVLPVVGQLGTLGAEEFDAVVGEGVVAGADDDAE